MIPPDPKYVTVAGSQVAYQVVGDGPIDLVYVNGIVSNLDRQWEWPRFARMLERMASYSRLIMFDRRGSGLSDPIALETLPTWEHWAEDLTAVLDAAGSERTAIFGAIDGCFWAMLFAATQPDRTHALVLSNPWARGLVGDDYGGFTQAEISRYVAENIPDARYVQIPGSDGFLIREGADKTQDIIEDFLSDVRHAGEPDRVLATILFTDIVGSTETASAVGDRKWKEKLASHDRLGRVQVERFGGKLVAMTGDGILATFTGPSRAIRCTHLPARSAMTTSRSEPACTAARSSCARPTTSAGSRFTSRRA